MNMELSLFETRVLGCLIEKEITTPEQYPLSLNALTNACNQRSNREPVLDLDEVTVQQVLDGLVKKYLVNEQGGFGSRVPKFQHRFCNSNYGTLKFTPQELGVVCELFLRGPQTPGELRSHTARLCRFGDVTEVEAVLQQLAEREDGPFVVRLPREPGKRESRYAHLFSGEPIGEISADLGQDAEHAGAAVRAEPSLATAERLAQLEQRIAALEAEVAVLRQQGADPAPAEPHTSGG